MSESLEKWIAAGLLFGLFFATLAHGAVEPWSLALFELMLIGILLLWGIKMKIDRLLLLTVPAPALPIAALLLLGVIQSVSFTGAGNQRVSLSLDVEATRQTVTLVFFMGLAFLAAVNFLAGRERLLFLANTLTIFGVVLAVFALFQHFAWNGRFYWLRPTSQTVFGPFVNRGHFAGYMVMLIPIPLALILLVVRGQARIVYGCAAAIMGTAAVISNSRSGLISLAASTIVLALLSVHARPSARVDDVLGLTRIAPIALVAGAMILSVLWIGASDIVEHFGNSVDQYVNAGTPDIGRNTIWQGTLNMIRAHPIFGVGLGAFITVYPTYETIPMLVRVNYAHNDYLQILAEGGIAGGLIAVWFLVVVLVRAYRGILARDPLCAAMSLAATAGIIAVMIQSITDTDLQIPSNALLFLILVAVVSRFEKGEIHESHSGAFPRRIAAHR
jgi:O-antigen ligase